MSAALDLLSYTPSGEPRGYIQPGLLQELWFHTGTACNLACPFCLEGSKPGDNRLNRVTLEDVRPFMEEAVSLGVRQFSFTGGEPFIVKDFIRILQYASNLNPCLVLTNGTDPVLKRIRQLEHLTNQPHPIAFRISIDFSDESRHDAARGNGSFQKALDSLRALDKMGFKISVARQMDQNKNSDTVDKEYRALFKSQRLPKETTIVSFPEFATPGSTPAVPFITENCMTTYHTKETREAFMCSFSKMVVKINNQMRVYACTLVDDDKSYDLGYDLRKSMKERIMMRHHRCYSCFAFGSSCSEI
jgi:sulfatase maturation enzyme AslB (radical SAM superfamily)|tara:strand:+ start:192 stop:1100 length:909 start_codon:yes stop_codon:yes gene_type:complete